MMSPDERRSIEWDCSRLINLYANLSDAGRWEEVANLYIPAAVMARPSMPDQLIRGRDAILASFLGRAPRHSRHFCANIVIEAQDQGHATGHSRILLFTGAADTQEGPPPLSGPPLVGEYQDRFTLTQEGWRFAERLGRLSFQP